MPSPSNSGYASLFLIASALGLGCTEPQSGLLTGGWCHPTAAEAQATVMLDDLEDGDAAPCGKAVPHWFVEGAGTLTPAVGPPATPTELSLQDPAVSRTPPSFRAQYLHGTVDAGGYAQLVLPLAIPDLTPYKEVDFWARSDSANLTIRVAVITPSVTDGDYFGGTATITKQWGDNGLINNYPLEASALAKADEVTTIPPADLGSVSAIAFQFFAPGAATEFGFWIDDVQLKPR